MISVKSLSFSYPDGSKAIDNFNLNINENECVALVGANGVGKTTFLLLLTGILFPVSGEIIINGIKVDKNSLDQVRKEIGMLFQNPDDQLFMNNVYDDVAFGAVNLNFNEEEVKEKVLNALKATNTAHLVDKKPYRLSSGEKRRVAMASILSMSPRILVMDEPTTSLDPKSRRMIIDLLKNLSHTKLIATHDLDFVLDLCDRVVVMNNGQVVADGNPFNVLKQSELMYSSGLEVPYRLQSTDS